MEFITRLTPNFLCWDKPSGSDGKCNGKLFESEHGFGWEEWLLKDYNANKNKPEYLCEGFIQAFNGKNQNRAVKILHLYTRVCNNQIGIKSGCYYLGYIENIQVGSFGQYRATEVKTDLRNVGLKLKSPIEVRNVQFKIKDVHIICSKEFMKHPLNLKVGQFRFALYDLQMQEHQNLKKQIIKYTKLK
jgi:hypothetical protein